MKIEVNIRHRPIPGETGLFRHQVAIRSLRFAPGLTNQNASDYDCALEFAENDEWGTGVSDLTPICSDGIRAATVYSPCRTELPDMAMYDNSLFLFVDPELADYKSFIQDSLPVVLREFAAYRTDVWLNEDLALDDHRRAVNLCVYSGEDVDSRRVVRRINPVNYFDRQLCQLAFGATPENIAAALNGRADRAEILGDGVYLIVTSSILSRAEIEAIDSEIRPLIDCSMHK